MAPSTHDLCSLTWPPKLVGLAESPDEYLKKGFTPEKQARALASIARDHGMPIDSSVRPRMAATMPACRAVVAARLHAPEAERALLRRLRIRHFSGELLDKAVVRTADGTRIAVPGFQPFPVYDVVTANLVPGVDRREAPDDVAEVLRWAETPLASKEVAVVCDISVQDAREALGHVADEQHVGFDGFWSLKGAR